MAATIFLKDNDLSKKWEHFEKADYFYSSIKKNPSSSE
ncbi:hypothetical protein LEP1GSC082_3652 [Leptospira kirschneri str. H2]|uniref:Uncharacterized protein n=1 Tax=Leptospira kirschneri serovar Bulgarica str. Nikolaevo TaxID=1240687 RepID=M6FII6_9LEPT|nr:hypothetical protein LEP1GSC082_3652 [Leptospira kirschneri str. H2]EMK25894.1 hypothetical protein LEP1GSC008_2328 [Leptospira kirschneri serovar Bulgarica str. Nikolaevo]